VVSVDGYHCCAIRARLPVALTSGSTVGEQQSRIAPGISGVAYESTRVGDSVFRATRTEALQQWLQSPWWDSLWMLSGLWLLLIVMCAQSAGYVPLVPRLLAGFAVGLLWGGHILSPIVVGWANHGLRSHMLLHWPQFVALPVGIFLTSVFLGVLGDMSQWTVRSPMLTTSLNPRLVLFYAFILWNTWHFAAQHFGVLSIYRRTAGQRSNRDRWLDRWFCIAMTCVLTPMAWYAQDRSEFFGPLFGSLPSPSAMPALGTVVMVTAATLTVA
jgi:hypothetical protein